MLFRRRPAGAAQRTTLGEPNFRPRIRLRTTYTIFRQYAQGSLQAHPVSEMSA